MNLLRFKSRYLVVNLFLGLSLLSVTYLGAEAKLALVQGNYKCMGEFDPIAAFKADPKKLPDGPNSVACVYTRKFESTEKLVRDTLQFLLSGGALSFGDKGKVVQLDKDRILFKHESVQMMQKMYETFQILDKYYAPGANDLIKFVVDVYFLDLDAGDDLDLSMQFTAQGLVPANLPRFATDTISEAPSVSLIGGNRSSSFLKLTIGRAKQKGYVKDHYSRVFYKNHNQGFHVKFDGETIYRGDANQIQPEKEDAGMQLYGSARFTSNSNQLNINSLAGSYAIRTSSDDSLVGSDDIDPPTGQVILGEPIYLMHKRRQYSREFKKKGLFFYEKSNEEKNSILLITLTPFRANPSLHEVKESSLFAKANSTRDLDLPEGHADSLKDLLGSLSVRITQAPNPIGHRVMLQLDKKFLDKLNHRQVLDIQFKKGPIELEKKVYKSISLLASHGYRLPLVSYQKLTDLQSKYNYKLILKPDGLIKGLTGYEVEVSFSHYPDPQGEPSVNVTGLEVRPASMEKTEADDDVDPEFDF